MRKIIYILLLSTLTVALVSLSGLDIFLESLLYNASETPVWIYSQNPIWTFLYHRGPYIPLAVGAVFFVVLLLSYFVKKLKAYRYKALIAVLLLVIAPGLIVQNLKISWGRPRPSELVQFGGSFEYRTPFQPNFELLGNTSQGNSMPSGHASIGFYLLVFFFISKKKKALLFTLGFIYGGLMGVGRMAQGGHFLSDVLISFFIVYIVGEFLKVVILKKIE